VAHAYSARNQPVSIGATTYVHDALGREALRNSTQVFRYAGLSATPSSFGNQSYATADGVVLASKVPGSAIASVHLNDHLRGDYNASLHPTAATLIAHRGYSPFGVSTAESGAALSRIGFQGDWSDPTTRLVHADRRVYDPATSVFTTRDELARGAAGSPGHNRYLYGAASPLVHTDRSGNIAIPVPLPDVFDAVKGGFDAVKGGLAGVGAGVGAGVAWVGGKAAAAAGLLGVGAAVVGVFAIGFGIGYALAAGFSWAWSGGTQADGLPGCVRCGPVDGPLKPPPVEKQLPLTEFVPVEFPAGTPLTGLGAAETLMDSAALSSGSNVAAVVSVVGAAASGLLAVDGFSEAADEQYAEAARDGVAGGQQGDGCGRGGLDVGDAVELALDIYEQLRPDDALPGVPWLSPGGKSHCSAASDDSARESSRPDRVSPSPAAPRLATNSLPVHAPGSLSAAEARSFYWQGENAIASLGDDLAARGVGLEARAREMFETRNALRSHVRDLMSDQNAADYLRRTSPNLTWDEMVARKAGQGLSGDDIYEAIINTSSTSNAGVDAAFGGRR
jgi:RHS repeat-associated protein